MPLESILAHNQESLAALKSIVERERARTLTQLQSTSAGHLPPELANGKDNRSLADIVLASMGAAGGRPVGDDVDTDMDEGDDATDIEAD